MSENSRQFLEMLFVNLLKVTIKLVESYQKKQEKCSDAVHGTGAIYYIDVVQSADISECVGVV